MNHIDVFNGDADGICALHQLRLHQSQPDARLLSGVKRDITLLEQLIAVDNSVITVLDISLDRNRSYLQEILSRNNTVFYADHHYAGDIPQSDSLTVCIDPAPLTCTSLIIYHWLPEAVQKQNVSWAIIGAFGDNLDESALTLAKESGLTEDAVSQLRETGILLN
ncbi:MAG: hypothetical protein KAI39_05850 [Desulfobulbaceae bacterium]|nr:hypothetical protein [Desulfobulbaceae bacterium]